MDKRNDDPSSLQLSAFVICKNEAAYIEACLRSLDLCSDIVVVDSGSTDETPQIVARLIEEGLPIRFLHRDWPGYAAQKQFALEQCTGEWCLNIDADERLDGDLREALSDMVCAREDIVAWRIRRRPYLIGYGFTPPHVFERPNLRLIRRGKGAYDLRQRVHEGIVPAGKVEISHKGSLLHFRPLPMGEQILKENAYSTLKSDQLIDEGRTRPKFRMLLTPPYYFLRLYIGRRLFLCGWPGFIQAMTGAVYSFMTEVKVYQNRALQERPPLDEEAKGKAET